MEQQRCPDCAAALPGAPGEVRFCPYCGAKQVPVTAGVEAAGPPGAGAATLPAGRGQTSAWVEYLDAAWDFFASTRVATVLIFILAVASIVGSLIEQESLYQDWRPPELYYPARYGAFWGPLFMRLGFTHAYTSVWYLALLYMIVVSLVICSLQRLVPLHRALQNPPVERHLGFIRRQDVTATLPAVAGDALAPLAAYLKRHGFRVLRRGRGLHADRGRLSRYGPYIIHIGLIVAAGAAAAKSLPGWDVTRDMWVADGQTVTIPGTGLAIRSEGFVLEQYENGMPRLFKTTAVLLDSGQEVLRHDIRVNHPLKYQNWEIYQASYNAEPGIASFDVKLADTQQKIGEVRIDLKDPAPAYDLGQGYRARVEEYYPDFDVDPQTGLPFNKSRQILRPVFRLSILDAGGNPVGAQALAVGVQPGEWQQVPLIGQGPVYLQQTGVKMRWYSGLKAHKDLSIPYMFTGLGIIMLGMWITFFVFHRQVWALATPEGVLIGARTNKNRFGLVQEMRKLVTDLDGELTGGLTVLHPGAREQQQGGDLPVSGAD